MEIKVTISDMTIESEYDAKLYAKTLSEQLAIEYPNAKIDVDLSPDVDTGSIWVSDERQMDNIRLIQQKVCSIVFGR